MAKKPRDPDRDVEALVAVLRDQPDRVFENAGRGNLSDCSGVPKVLVRRLLTGHPNVTIGRSGQKFTFQFRQ